MNFLVGQRKESESLVRKFHYSKRPPANVQFVGSWFTDGGLFGDQGQCIAAAFFSIPPTRWNEEIIELSRLVRNDSYNVVLSKLISLCLKELKKTKFDLVISFADYTQNHHGGVYQACSWFFGGKRDKRMDGLEINGKFVPGRTCNSMWGTSSPHRLKEILRFADINPHFDEGKFLYWKPIKKSGFQKAERLKLKKLEYPKPQKAAA